MKPIRILIFIFLFFLSPTLSAAPIDSKQAAKIADEFMESVKKRFPTGYTRTVIDLKEVYVINYWAPNQRLGFVVVAGDDSLPSKVLAFSMEGEIKKKNKTISAVLEDYCSEIREWQAGKSISTEYSKSCLIMRTSNYGSHMGPLNRTDKPLGIVSKTYLSYLKKNNNYI